MKVIIFKHSLLEIWAKAPKRFRSFICCPQAWCLNHWDMMIYDQIKWYKHYNKTLNSPSCYIESSKYKSMWSGVPYKFNKNSIIISWNEREKFIWGNNLKRQNLKPVTFLGQTKIKGISLSEARSGQWDRARPHQWKQARPD